MSRSLHLWLATLATVLLLATTATAETFYVDNATGNDRNDGSSATVIGEFIGPYRTINRALRQAGTGDRIVLAKNAEPYREVLSLYGSRHSGFENQPFVLEGNGAVLDGTGEVPVEGWKHQFDSVFRFQPELVYFQRLFLNGQPATERWTRSRAEPRPLLEPGQWTTDDRGGILLRTPDDKLPESFGPRYSVLKTGITMYKVYHCHVRNLTVQGFQQDGVNVQDTWGDCRVVGVRALNNGRSGITVAGAARVALAKCELTNNGREQLRTEGYTRTWTTGMSYKSIDGAQDIAQLSGEIIPIDGEL